MTAIITGCWHVTSHPSSSQKNPGGAAAHPLTRAQAEEPPPLPTRNTQGFAARSPLQPRHPLCLMEMAPSPQLEPASLPPNAASHRDVAFLIVDILKGPQ